MSSKRNRQFSKRVATYGRAVVSALGNFGPTEVLKDYLGNDYTMAKRQKAKKRTSKRRAKKILKKIPRAVQPYSIVREIKTSFQTSFNPGAGTIQVVTWPVNSAYDPMYSLGTQQGLGFSQYAALYQRYCVVGYKLTGAYASQDNSNPIIIGLTTTPSASALTAYDHYKELPHTVQKIVTPDIDKNYLKIKGGIRKWFAIKKGNMLTDDTVTASVTADPSKLLYVHCYAQAMDKTSDPGAVLVNFTISQMVVFYQPKVPTRSTA